MSTLPSPARHPIASMQALQAMHRMLESRRALTEEGARRLARIEALFADNVTGDRP